ncbi:TetR/AcrR family transcriptional regulator [Albimonas sp. CAU 1670]|uniref:TetR/AcrR family transcriptional regulator n=1 Tax=Albimonas sp. CAU 1670 TaxID=3032599 RepID=UPI0023DC6C2B|nr:TetR/AcrR family transcriptional regulator [Albimonas sp. CAU 1670]MDF2231753.1 TetR/AcrR family transcriptional regulator [Albimonas sp. CAU 1670]
MGPDEADDGLRYRAIGLRMPQRRRGRERFDALLDAARDLLAEDDGREISLADVAQAAGAPLPSLYHFFTNRNALLVALARRRLEALAELAARSLDPPPETWQDLVRRRQRVGAGHLNRHPDALRLFMGAGVSAEVRMMDLRGNVAAGARRAREMRAAFRCGELEGLERWMAYAISIGDGVWALSWAEHRRITEAALEESCAAAVAYLRGYLPEHLPRRFEDGSRS